MGAVDSRAGVDHAALTWEDYARAERFLPWNAAKLVFGLEIDPHWIEDGDSFWYRASTSAGPRFIRVDPVDGRREPAFDHDRLAAGLSRASGVSAAGDNLPFSEIAYEDGGAAVRFTVDEKHWVCDLTTYTCVPANELAEKEAPADASRSPDGAWEVFVRDHNVWIRAVGSGNERVLTTDGEAGYAYGSPIASPLTSAGIGDPEKPVAIWSADSTRFVSCRIDQRQAKLFHLVQSVPKDGNTRPVLHTYAYPLPGDDEIPGAEVWSFSVDGGDPVKAGVDPLPMLYHGYPLNKNAVWWSVDGSRFHLLTRDRGFRAYRLWEVDATSGDTRQVIEEEAERGIEPYLFWGDVNVRVLDSGNEIIWYAQREGWGHLYLYGTDGNLIRQVTSGPFNVAGVAHVDEAGRWLYFTAMGREPGSDPYYSYLYRVSLDGGEPELLTPEDREHAICFSPSGRFVLDTYSRVDQPPVTVLRTSAGAVVRELERADISSLTAAGYQLAERFTAKARDGRTDIYGVLLRPSTFDPARVYPVIDYIYAGPQMNVAPASFAGTAPFGDSRQAGRERGYWHAQALAELGFVVVMVDGLGMPGRSKAYHDVSYRNLGDGGLADHVAAIRQLADRYPYLDDSRVGIYGHSAGGYASARAILMFPDFYKVCVSSAGNHDHRLDKASWVERYMALPVEDHYRDQANKTHARNLKGKLLLIHGEMDENVHPASTLALVDALIKENKDFDLLIIPNRPHRMDNDPYFVRRRWDYFARHLLGAEPPAGYRIADEADA